MGGTSSLGVRDGVQVKGAGQVLEPDGAQELPTRDQGLVGLAPQGGDTLTRWPQTLLPRRGSSVLPSPQGPVLGRQGESSPVSQE